MSTLNFSTIPPYYYFGLHKVSPIRSILRCLRPDPNHLLTEELDVEPDSAYILLNIPFQSLSYTAYENNRVPEPLRIAEEDIGDVFSPANFGQMLSFAPTQMQVVEASSSRGDMPARVCLLGRDRSTYKVFALPERWEPKMHIAEQGDVTDVSMG